MYNKYVGNVFRKKEDELVEVFDNYAKCKNCDEKFLLATECQDYIDGMVNPWINEELVEGTFCYECIAKLEMEVL